MTFNNGENFLKKSSISQKIIIFELLISLLSHTFNFFRLATLPTHLRQKRQKKNKDKIIFWQGNEIWLKIGYYDDMDMSCVLNICLHDYDYQKVDQTRSAQISTRKENNFTQKMYSLLKEKAKIFFSSSIQTTRK